MDNEFKHIDGKILITTSEVVFKPNNFSKRQLKEALKHVLIGLILSFFYKFFLKDDIAKTKIFGYAKSGYMWFILIFFLALIIYAVFYLNFRKKISINDISEVEINKAGKFIIVTITKSNKRFKMIDFSKENNELDKFIDLLKKRNTRIKIIEL